MRSFRISRDSKRPQEAKDAYANFELRSLVLGVSVKEVRA